LYRY